MRLEDHSMHFNYFRMRLFRFDNLLYLVGLSLRRQRSHFRELLPSAPQLGIALRYPATGEGQASLSLNFRIANSLIVRYLAKCQKRCGIQIGPIAVSFPGSVEEWKRISSDFWNLWGLPLCLGDIDGKHCVINCPPNSGSALYNYKGAFGLVLMAV